MGLNANILIADSRLRDDHLMALGLKPLDRQIRAEEVLLTPADERACVVRAESSTIIIDGGEALAEAVDAESLAVPGRVHFAASVSSVGFVDFCVFADGKTVRHLREEDGETSIDEGRPVPGEELVRVPADDGDAEQAADGRANPEVVADAEAVAEGETELDGDLLIEKLTVIAGLPESFDLFALTGEGFGAAAVAPEPEFETGVDGDAARTSGGRKPGFLSRLLGR
ncbi:hypothetical protein ACH82I_03710 [Brevibacterium sp. GP-SGM9]|uniref:hypothetical protein n=1 Tax=Brevibacterium sp. GP-SGM9 TaxID=3376990 RepID=UPI0039A5B4E9